MLYYVQDKLLSTPFPTLWNAVQEFMDLAHPGSRELHAVTLRLTSGSSSIKLSVWYQGTATSRARVLALARRARQALSQGNESIYLRWHPQFGPKPVDYARAPLNPQFTLAQQSARTTWAFIMLPTSFTEVDRAFLMFLERAHSALPFGLPPRH